MELAPTINRKKLQKALMMYRNYLNEYSSEWSGEQLKHANKTLLTLWVFFSETVKFDNKEGYGFEEDAESVNEFCDVIIEELLTFNKNNKQNKNDRGSEDFVYQK